MILGVGVDLCVVDRVSDLADRYGDRVLKRLFTDAERSRCSGRRRFECLAGRFAAKEAALKALGTGLSQGIAWRDVEVVGSESGRPTLAFHRRAKELVTAFGAKRAHLSITHDGGHAVAVCVLEGDPR